MMGQIVQLSSRRRRRKAPRDFRPVLARQAALARRDPPAVALAAPALLMPGTARVSQINPAYPVYGTPTTVTVRNNFQAAKDEIEELQNEKLDLAGGTMTGQIVFVLDQPIDGGTF
jgi:hypothetical protein